MPSVFNTDRSSETINLLKEPYLYDLKKLSIEMSGIQRVASNKQVKKFFDKNQSTTAYLPRSPSRRKIGRALDLTSNSKSLN
jgi:hypothetical protein